MARRWSQVIRTGLPDVSVTVAAGACGTGEPGFSGPVDDVTIDATIATIDGVGGILGQAGIAAQAVNHADGAVIMPSHQLAKGIAIALLRQQDHPKGTSAQLAVDAERADTPLAFSRRLRHLT